MIVLGNLYGRIDSIGNEYKIKKVKNVGVLIEDENILNFFIINDF